MTTAMHANDTVGAVSPRGLQPGTLVYLWGPGEEQGSDRRILAQVERTTVDHIVAFDRADEEPQRRTYEVGAMYPATMRWTWEVAAPPLAPVLDCGRVKFTNRLTLTREERRQLLLGNVGAYLTIYLAGGTSVDGVVTEVVYEDEDPVWLLVASPADARKPYIARVQVDQITKIMEVVGG